MGIYGYEGEKKLNENGILKGWIGTEKFLNGNIRSLNAERNDYYATDPKAIELLLEQEAFSRNVWEPACGEGHISKVLEEKGYNVRSSDLIDRGYGTGEIDFLNQTSIFDGDIITNPPYKYAKEFVEKALALVPPGNKVAMFLKLTFLEGKVRRELFRNNPPMVIYVSSDRLRCGKNGVFEGPRSAVAYAWFIWRRGYPRPDIRKMV